MDSDSDSKPDGYIAQILTQILIQIGIPDYYCTHFWERYPQPDRDPSPCQAIFYMYNVFPSQGDTPLDCLRNHGRICGEMTRQEAAEFNDVVKLLQGTMRGTCNV